MVEHFTDLTVNFWCLATEAQVVQLRSPGRRRCSPLRPWPDPVLRRPADGDKVVYELLLTRSPPGIGVSVIDRAARYLRCC